MRRLDQVGYWTELKLDIVRDYAAVYSKILAAQTNPPFQHLYIDAFAGPGAHVSRASGELIPGSPTNALAITPPFYEYHLIDMDGDKVKSLAGIVAERGAENVHLYQGDCNEILLEKVFPRVERTQYRRALCLLDPYNINLNWRVLETAGRMGTIEVFVNFMVMGINRDVLRKNPESIEDAPAERMNRFWGDESWRDVAYSSQGRLFDDLPGKTDNETLAEAFRQRLNQVAGFRYAPKPLPMRNSQGAVIYYLFFASPNQTGGKIVRDIFDKYRDRGVE